MAFVSRNVIVDLLLTALAPAIWGSTYIVTSQFLPPDRPFIAALLRVVGAGLVAGAVVTVSAAESLDPVIVELLRSYDIRYRVDGVAAWRDVLSRADAPTRVDR